MGCLGGRGDGRRLKVEVEAARGVPSPDPSARCSCQGTGRSPCNGELEKTTKLTLVKYKFMLKSSLANILC